MGDRERRRRGLTAVSGQKLGFPHVRQWIYLEK
jgi:hypothetical protein